MAVADRIRVSTDMLEKWARDLSMIQDGLSDAESILASVSFSEGAGEGIRVTADQKLNNGAHIMGQNAAEVVQSLRSVLGRTSEDTGEVSRALSKAAELFESAEADNKSLLMGVEEEGEAYGDWRTATGSGGMTTHQYHNHAPSDMSKRAIEKKAREWGRKKDTISDTEYAFLASSANTACREKNSVKKKKAFMDQLSQLPSNHPLRDVDSKQVKVFSAMGVEGFIIELDNHNAVVVFAGTDDVIDFVADAGIATLSHRNPVKETQKLVADLVVGNLERRGYDNIQVAGHSLGGYLATDVAMKHKGVSECVTFDAPKHTALEVAANYSGTQDKSYRNYNPNGGIVNKAGMVQPGTTTQVTVQENWAGPLHNHQIVRILEDGMGGMDEINRQWKA